ncbi:MAG TPA: hypothetical protein VGK73_40800 [Polyangiaceae bacterium]
MELDVNSLFAGFLVSGIGFVLLVYGKRVGRPPQIVTGIVLLLYPYFVSGVALTLSIGAALLAALGVMLKLGW